MFDFLCLVGEFRSLGVVAAKTVSEYLGGGVNEAEEDDVEAVFGVDTGVGRNKAYDVGR